MELIEEGGYGSVYRKLKPNDIKVAVKQMFLNKDCLFFAAFKEVNSLRILDHPNIVSFHNMRILVKDKVPKNVGSYILEVELDLWDTDLQTLMTKKYTESKTGLCLTEALKLFTQLLSTVIYLHDNGILHLDLKPANILINQNKESNICLCDFGCCSYYPFDGIANIGTINCRPPENFIYFAKGKLLDDLQKVSGTGNVYSTATDTFSCGVIFLYLLTGKCLLYPENDFRNSEIPDKRLSEFISFHTTYIESFLLPIRSSIEREYLSILNLLTKMLALHPKDRPQLRDVLNDSLFDGYKPSNTKNQGLRSPLYMNIALTNLDVKSFLNTLKPAFNYFEESLCSFLIVKTTLDIAIRYFILNKAFDFLDLVASLRIAFIFFDDNEDLPLNMFNRKYKSREVDLRCLNILRILNGYLVRRTPFDSCQNITDLDNLFQAYIQIKPYFSWTQDNERRDKGEKFPDTWIDIVCKSTVVKQFLLR